MRSLLVLTDGRATRAEGRYRYRTSSGRTAKAGTWKCRLHSRKLLRRGGGDYSLLKVLRHREQTFNRFSTPSMLSLAFWIFGRH
jgi:hypothetical protein